MKASQELIVLGMLIVLIGVSIYVGVAAGATVVNWNPDVTIFYDEATQCYWVGKYVTYTNNRDTVGQICPHVVVSGDAHVDTGIYHAWAVNPGQSYRALLGAAVPASYVEQHVHVVIECYVSYMYASGDQMVLESQTEFDAVLPALQKPSVAPDIVLANYSVQVQPSNTAEAPYAITIYATLTNTGTGTGVAEYYCMVDGEKVPPGDLMYYTQFMQPGSSVTIRLGAWLWRGGSIVMHVNSKPNVQALVCAAHDYTLSVTSVSMPQSNSASSNSSSISPAAETPVQMHVQPAGEVTADYRTLGLGVSSLGAAVCLAGLIAYKRRF